jgi:hypothetical protein
MKAWLTKRQEFSGSGKCIGYKTMWKRLRLKYGLRMCCFTVLRLMLIADPAIMERRKRRRLLRRQYSCPGPYFVWHIDGHDKIKPFGFAIHGQLVDIVGESCGCLLEQEITIQK